MRKIILLLFFLLSNNLVAQIGDDYIGKWVSKLNDVVYIYSGGTYYGNNYSGDWRILNDGKLEVIAGPYRIYYDLSDDFNNLIFEYYMIGQSKSEKYNIIYEKFSSYKYLDISKQRERINNRLILKEELKHQKELEEKILKNKIEQEKLDKEKEKTRKINENIENGDNYLLENNFEIAIECYQKAFEIDKMQAKEICRDNYALGCIGIADKFYNSKNYEKSEFFYKKALELKDNDNEIINKLLLCMNKIAEKEEINTKYEKAIEKYNEILKYDLNYSDKNEINKKIAKIYEKVGDDNFKRADYRNASEQYELSEQYYSNENIKKKVFKTKEIINKSSIKREKENKYRERLEYNLETRVAIIGTVNNKSDKNFQDLFGDGFGYDISGSYRFNPFLSVGIGLSFLSNNCKNVKLLLTSVNYDTTNLRNFKSNGTDGNLKIKGVSLFSRIGYFLWSVNPYAIFKIHEYFYDIDYINFQKYLPNLGGVYEDAGASINSGNFTGFSYGLGFRVGSDAFKVDVNIVQNKSDGNLFFKKYNNLEFNAGLMIIFKLDL